MFVFCFSACDSGNEPNGNDNNGGKTEINTFVITAKVEDGGNLLIDSICVKSESGSTIASSLFINGVFSVELPIDLSEDRLYSIQESETAFDLGLLPIDDRNTKILPLFGNAFQAYKNGIQIGYFKYSNSNAEVGEHTFDGHSSGVFWFSDRSANIKSNETANRQFDISLKKGWNLLIDKYYMDNGNLLYKVVTNDATENFKWFFMGNKQN